MENINRTQQIQINRLRITVGILAVALSIAGIIIIKLQSEHKLVGARTVGGRIDTIKANDFVKRYTKGLLVLNTTNTSFLMDKKLLDSFSTHPLNKIPTFYRIFLAKNEDGDKTLVITGAYYDTIEKMIRNTHIEGGYDIEHVFPIDDDGTVHRLDTPGKTWQAYRFPDNTN